MNYGFDTLVKKSNIKYDNRWKPLRIVQIEQQFNRGCLHNIPDNIRKNISYNLQYLEYLAFQFSELNLNSAITMSLIKNYIINGISIIEAIFYWLIKSNNLSSRMDIELIFSTKSNEVKHNNQKIIMETKVYKKVPPYEVEMTFDMMIKKIEAKRLLNLDHKIFPYIKKYRHLRNRIHLHLSENINDTDWWIFEYYDYLLIRFLLYKVLSDPNIKIIDKNNNIFYFLKLSSDEIQKLSDHLKKQQE